MKFKFILGGAVTVAVAVALINLSTKSEVAEFSEAPVNQVPNRPTAQDHTENHLESVIPQGDINASVKFITAQGGSSGEFVQRNLLLHKLELKHLQEQDLIALLNFLKQEPTGEGRHLAFHSLKNDIMSLLIESGHLQEQLAATMLDDMKNQEAHAVWREYIVQYTPDLIAAIDLNHAAAVNQSDQLIKALWQVSTETSGALAGTALLSLHALSHDFTPRDSLKLNQLIKQVALSPDTAAASRMGAVDLLRQVKAVDSLPELKELCFDDNESATLRMSAINATYHLSGQDELFKQELQVLYQEDDLDPRLQSVIKNLIK